MPPHRVGGLEILEFDYEQDNSPPHCVGGLETASVTATR